MNEQFSPGRQIIMLLLFTFSGLAVIGPVLFLLFLSIFGGLPDNLEDFEAIGPNFTYVSTICGMIGIFLMSFLLFLKLTNQKVKDVIFTNKFQLKSLGLALLGLVVMWFAAELLYLINHAAIELIPNNNFLEMEEELNADYQSLFNPTNKNWFPLALIVFAAVPAFVEELVFRGLLLKNLKDVSGNPHFAVIVSSLMFAAFHFQAWNILPMTGLAILFGYTYVYTKDIRYSMLMHFLYNGVQMGLMFFMPGLVE